MNENQFRCYKCSKVVEIEELEEIDAKIEALESPTHEEFAQYFVHCVCDPDQSHGEGNINVCKVCFSRIMNAIKNGREVFFFLQE